MKNHSSTSLKIRLATTVALVFIFALIAFASVSRNNLREDILTLTSHQLSSAAQVAATQLNHDFDDRFEGLAIGAKFITQPMIDNPALLKDEIKHRPVLSLLFNHGLYLIKPDGTSISDQPHSTQAFADQASIQSVLSGQVTHIVSAPNLDTAENVPTFLMVTAIKNEQDQVIGALAGATNLTKDNFISKVTSTGYGKTGGFIIIDPKHRIIVSATDKSRNMEHSPPPGRFAAIDKSLEGYEGISVFVNPKGVEVIESSKHIPIAGWQVIAAIPAAEVFSPIRQMNNFRVVAGILITFILMIILTWWTLRRQLNPITEAAQTLSRWSKNPEKFPQEELIIHQHDEVGILIKAFNQLLSINRERDARLSLATHTAGIGVWDLNLQTMELIWDDTMLELFDINREEFNNTIDASRALLHPDDRQRAKEELEAVINNGKSLDIEFRIICKNNAIRYIKAVGKAFYGKKGIPIRVLGVNMDVTNITLIDKMKSELMATAAHELRTPMTMIHGYTELLKMDVDIKDTQREMLDVIHRQSQAMIDLLNNMLDIAKIEAQATGLYEMKLQSIGPCLKTLADTFITADNHNKVNLTLSPNLPEVNVDIAKLEQAVKNCLSNAYKFSPKRGEVSMKVTEVMHNKQRNVLIAIEDQGIGMTPEQLERVFEKFYRADPAGTILGAGLGMSIIKSIIEQHGGSIEIESNYGKGTKVMLYLPVA